MNILYVTALPLEVNNSSQLRNIALVKGLIENGCNVTILCADKSFALSSTYSDSFPGGVYEAKIIRINKQHPVTNIIYASNSNHAVIVNKLRTLYRKFSIYKGAGLVIKEARRIKLDQNNYDSIISSSDPKASHEIVKSLLNSNVIQTRCWVQYWGDPLLMDITDNTCLPRWYKKRIEFNILKRADKIIYVSPFTRDLQIKTFAPLSDKMTFLPPPYIEAKTYLPSNNKKITLGYYGSYSSTVRNINPLYKALNISTEYKLIIAGNSDLPLSNTRTIQIYSRLNRNEIEVLTSKSDVLVCILNKHGTQIPGKIYDYASTNKPIIIITDGNNRSEMGAYLKQFNRFVICENTEESILEAVGSIEKCGIEYEPSPYFAAKIIAKQVIEMINYDKKE